MRPIPPLTEPEIERFWEHVLRVNSEECWPWNGTRTTGGYGIFSLLRGEGRNLDYKAHRIAYLISFPNKDISHLLICHCCDNPPCCNPAHLFAGSQADNMGDCYEKGRLVIAKEKLRGERHWMHKLTEADVREIRSLCENSDLSYPAIGRMFGVRGPNIRAIATGEIWSQIPGWRAPKKRKSGARGQFHGRAKLDAAKVSQIRQEYVPGKVTILMLARKFGVTETTIANILHGKTWKEIES